MLVKTFIIFTGTNESLSVLVLSVTASYHHQIKSYLIYMDYIYRVIQEESALLWEMIV